MDAEILPESAQRVSKGCPHCRDAPWGVSEAATSPVLSQTPRGCAVALGIVLSAPETPHGASLQWGPRRNRHFRDTPYDDTVSSGGCRGGLHKRSKSSRTISKKRSAT